MAAKNGVWLMAGLVIVGGVFLALSLTKNHAPQQAAPVPVAVEIKPGHTPADMEKIAAASPGAGMVEEPKIVHPRMAYAVQVYSFKDKVRADASLRQLREKGYPAYVMMSDLGPRGVFYRVRVGSFASEEEAKKSLVSVTKDFKSGIIVAE